MSNISIISVMSVTSVDAVVSVFFLCSDSGQDEDDGVVPVTYFIPFPEFKNKNRRRIHSPNKPKLFSSSGGQYKWTGVEVNSNSFIYLSSFLTGAFCISPKAQTF